MPAGHSSSVGGSASRTGKVTTPSGPHGVASFGGRNPSLGTPLRGVQERFRRSTVNMTSIRAGQPTVSPVTTAQVRQHAPFPARTFGMAPVVRVRRTAPLR